MSDTEKEPVTVDSGAAAAKPRGEASKSFGHFAELREIGQGGQGIVYEAQDLRLRRPVALKLLLGMTSLHGEKLSRFLREAEVAAHLDHDGICTVYESGMENGVPYIAMQYVRGRSLAEWVDHWAEQQPDGRLETVEVGEERRRIERVVRWGIALAEALSYAHEAGVVHRDIKPGNVLVREDDAPIILDFGLARREVEDQAVTMSGVVLGTPAYMPPEQLTGEAAGQLDARGDIYSLGVTLYELLTLERPFSSARIEELADAVRAGACREPRRINRLIPPDLQTVVSIAMETDPERRYRTAEDLARDLRNVAEHRTIEARPVSRLVRLSRWYQRNPRVAWVGAVAVLSLVSGLTASLFWLGVARRNAEDSRQHAAEARQHAREAEQVAEKFERVAASLKLQELLTGTGPSVWRLDRDDRALRAWIDQAEGLVAGLPKYREDLERLREAAIPIAPEEGRELVDLESPEIAELLEQRARLERELEVLPTGHPSRGTRESQLASLTGELEKQRAAGERERWRFETQEDQWLHDQIVVLIDAIEDMKDVEKKRPAALTIPSLERRLAVFAQAEERLHGGRAESWRALEERLRAQGEPLPFEPVRDLVPLGPDPLSGLEEFALVGTGPLARRPAPGEPLELAFDAGIVLVLIPGGEIQLGQRPGDLESRENEDPWEATLAPFLIAKHETTRAQWLHVMGDRPSFKEPEEEDRRPEDDRRPVDFITWNRAVEFCERVGAVLPTEAQWAFADHADSTTVYPWGEAPQDAQYFANLYDRATDNPNVLHWNDGFKYSAPVGSFEPNVFGLFDMQGNVHEWCRDLYVKNRVSIHAVGDALAMHGEDSSFRVFRGSSWYNLTDFARCSRRDSTTRNTSMEVLGFRVARSLEPPQRGTPAVK